MNNFFEFPLGVIAHDAGAANHIIAWLKGCDHHEMHVCMEGPAAKLWEQSLASQINMPLNEIVSRSSMLLTGTGWESTLEHDARKLARVAGVKSAAVIDHWTNYPERFVHKGETVLPDEIWVTDKYARNIAEDKFPGLKIVQLPNIYLDSMVRRVRECEQAWQKRTGKHLLYVLEPIREAWGCTKQQGEFQALNYFIENLELLQLGCDLSIRLRLHPSEPQGKYDQWIEANRNIKISIDESSTIAESVAWSDVVVGCQTYAMVVALAAEKKVISSIPPSVPACILPQTEIIKLSDLVH